MEITGCGITKIQTGRFIKKLLWVSASELTSPAVICVNSEIMQNTVISEDRSLLTTELPQGLASLSGEKLVQILNPLTGELSEAASVIDMEPACSTIDKKGKHVLISCFPKSGSTMLLRLLTGCTGFLSWPMVYEYGGNEQDIYIHAVSGAYCHDTITQQHVKATKTNLRIIDEYGFKTIVLVRNIFDTLVSLHDHVINESYEIPLLYINKKFESINFQGRIDMLIDLALPWYIDFYASWFNNRPPGTESTIWVTYDDLAARPRHVVDLIIEKFDLPTINGIDVIARSLGNTRLNVGRPGRGDEMLTEAQKTKIVDMLKHHPDVDFSRIL